MARSIPEPADDGYRIRVRALVEGLARVARVTLVGHADGSGPADLERLRAAGVEAHPVPSLHHPTPFRRARRLATRRPWLTRSADDPAMRSMIEAMVARTRFDIIQIEGSEFADLPFPAEIPVIVDEHNIWSELAERRRAFRAIPARGRLDTHEASQLRALERRVWGRAAGVAFCSEREVDLATERVPNGRYAVVPNGVDAEAYRPGLTTDPPIPGRLVFVGFLRYTPNADAARWLVEEILPAIRGRVPDASLDIVGKQPSPATLALADPATAIRVLGDLPDVRPALAAASVVVVPLRVGSGTRIKILEAMAMGRPVVATSLGAEGLGAQDGVHLLIADTPAAFADAVALLLGDEALRARLGAAGREFVLHGHTWDASVARLMDLHDEVLATTRSTT